MNASLIPRRTVLRATGTSLALPFLPSLGWKAFAAEQPVAPPKRMAFLSFGWGVTNETWFPDKTKTGADWPLSEGLAPLERHKSRFTVIQGLSNKFANEAHWGSTFYLTGANRYAVPGSSFSNSISADQVAAEAFGRHTRFTSLQLTSKDAEQSGHGPGLSARLESPGQAARRRRHAAGHFRKTFRQRENAACRPAKNAQRAPERARCRARPSQGDR